MEKDIREFLNYMYVTYGHNDVIIEISKIVDKFDTDAQKEKLEDLKCSSKS